MLLHVRTKESYPTDGSIEWRSIDKIIVEESTVEIEDMIRYTLYKINAVIPYTLI